MTPRMRQNTFTRQVTTVYQPLDPVFFSHFEHYSGNCTNTLSGGEAQRVKLASFLTKKDTSNNLLFIFDEPTTGLHFYDIEKLIIAFNALINLGHSLIVIEHNIEVIKCADHIIDLGPEGGKNGGNVLFEGTPEELIKQKNNETSRFLKKAII